jgi:hypothetical protein
MSGSTNTSGPSVLGLIGVVFITLKLCDVIDWSWWWVTAPFWGPFALLLAFLAVAAPIAFIAEYTRDK